MKTYKELLNLCESKQRGSLYHYTSFENAHDILDGNELNASELNEPRAISTTRNKDFHKGKGSIKTNRGMMKGGVNTDVSFELDGDKISQHKKIKPFNFLGFSGMNKPKHPHDESEEQIYGDLPNVKNYIKKIRIHSHANPEDVKRLEKHGIPLEHNS